MARIKTLGEVATPIEDYAIANKKYVDDASGGPGALEHIQISSDQTDSVRLDEFLRFAMDSFGSSSSESVRSPLPFDLTIVRIGLTVAIQGSNEGYPIDTGLALTEFNVNGVAEVLIQVVLPAGQLNIDVEVNIPIVSRPGNTLAWRIFNSSQDTGVVWYETHFHYVEQAQLNKNAGFKKYYDDRANLAQIEIKNKRFELVKSHVGDTSSECEKRLRSDLEFKKLCNTPKSQGDATSTSKTTAETNREQRHKSKKKVKSVHWQKLKSNEI